MVLTRAQIESLSSDALLDYAIKLSELTGQFQAIEERKNITPVRISKVENEEL